MSLLRSTLFVFVACMSMANVVQAQSCATSSNGETICAPPGGGAATNSNGEVVTGPGACLLNDEGQVICSQTAGGGAAKNSFGEVKTGAGQCITNSMGKVMCASEQGGGAALNSMGEAVCDGGCVDGQ
jgi:hypothetical protein